MSAFLTILQLMMFIIFVYADVEITQLDKPKFIYKWIYTEEWSQCSTSCGKGDQYRKISCVQNNFHYEIVSDSFCSLLLKPRHITRNCNITNCERRYQWRLSKWSECSQTCANAGRRSRDVECVFNEDNLNIVANNDLYCSAIHRPETISYCNILDCPPIFITGHWGKCVKSLGCLPGKQIRSLECVSLMKNGKSKKVSKYACYKRFMPPPSWRICYDYINTKECLKSNDKIPEIETKNNILVQMKKTKKFKIQIGQEAHVLLYTKVILRCPVNHFISKEIIWKNNGTVYKFNGHSKNRIKVDKKGRIRISKFLTKDQGKWTCFAGSVNASTIIISRNPSTGYQDWILRTALWNKEMLNEDPQTGIVKHEVVQWIKGSWSACSLSCGGEGIQNRQVHCEEIDTRYYTILNDVVCIKAGRKKPETSKTCLRMSLCPQWSLRSPLNTTCTNQCLRIGVAKITSNLSCIYQGKEIDPNSCDIDRMPSIDCLNSNCRVTWKISKWSKCSLSCGGVGIMARYLMCIWKNTGKPAGSSCYKKSLVVPRIIKTCKVPQCKLKCVDLSPNCHKREKFCKLMLYRYTCCSTCKNVYMKLKLKYNEIEKQKYFINVTRKHNIITSLMEITNLSFLSNFDKKHERNGSIYDTEKNSSLNIY